MKKIMTKERLCAFTDAILAIIMTILVLQLPRPAELTWAGIWALRMSFLAFAVSFFGLAIMWVEWHKSWHDVRAISQKTVWSTIIVLFFMAFLPYLTGLLASDLSSAVVQILYGTSITIITLFNSLSYRSLAAIDENKEIRFMLIARANLRVINTAIMLVCVLLSIFVSPYCSVIGLVIVSVTSVLPIFK